MMILRQLGCSSDKCCARVFLMHLGLLHALSSVTIEVELLQCIIGVECF